MRGRPGHSGPSRRAPTCDVLVVNNQNLIDIDSEDSRDFPFYGNPEHIEAEIKEVQLLLLRTTPSTVSSLGVAASTASPPRVHNVKENKPWLLEKKDNLDTSIKKDNKLIKASYGHNAESVKEITEDNNRLVKRLIGKANAPLTFKTSAANHDKVSRSISRCVMYTFISLFATTNRLKTNQMTYPPLSPLTCSTWPTSRRRPPASAKKQKNQLFKAIYGCTANFNPYKRPLM